MTFYEMLVEMLEDEQQWIMENSTSDEDEYEEYLNEKLGYNREVQYSLIGSTFIECNGEYRHMFDLDDVAITGKVFVIESGLSFVNPTRLDLCIAAEYVIHNTGDYSHTYLEGWEIKYDDTVIKYCELIFGS